MSKLPTTVYARHACVCVCPIFPRASAHQKRGGKTARGRHGCGNTHATTEAKFVVLLLLLLLERIRIVVVVGYLLRDRIRFVYAVLAGGAW